MRIRPFRRLWLVLGAASLGDWLGLLATATFAAAQVSGGAAKGFAFGGVIAVRLLPALVLGPLAGVMADRWDRRYTMVVCDLLRFVLFASIPTIVLYSDDAAVTVGWAAIATFLIESITLIWLPAKEAAVPNLIPRARLEAANQLTLVTTYGITPVLAAGVLAGLNQLYQSLERAGIGPIAVWAEPSSLALYFNALSRLATALVVLFGIREISGHRGELQKQTSISRQFIDGWKFVGRTPMVRGLVFGILGAFAAGGVVIGTAQFFATELNGGDSTFAILFAVIFIGLGMGIALGPRLIGALSRRRWFGLSIILAAGSVALLALATHLSIAVVATLFVGAGAGMAFLSGTTLLGGEVNDEMRGRVFAVVQTGTRVILMLAISLSGVLVGVGGSRAIVGTEFSVSSTRILLAVAGIVGVGAGLWALRQMDDKPGVPILPDLISSIRGRPLGVPEPVSGGVFVVFEGGEGAGKSTQIAHLGTLLKSQGRDVVVTREPGATEVGARIRRMVLETHATPPGPTSLAPRAEALLYAADRAHHVSAVVRPALARGAVVISDRYVDSSIAYQGAGRSLAVDEISWLSAWATGGLKPNLVVLLDIDPAIGLSRAGLRGEPDRLEQESLDFHERVRMGFLDLAAKDPARYLVLDASRDEKELAEEIAAKLSKLLPPLVAADGPPPPEPVAQEVPERVRISALS